MKKIKVANLVGARPQFIKASAISRALREQPDTFEEVLIHSGQHYDENMSEVFFTELGITPPKHSLNVGSGLHGKQTADILVKLESVLMEEQPDVLLVYGDTNTTLAGGIVAAKLHIPIAHVEAGLRSFNMNMPEEINRKAVDHISKWLFCPTKGAVELLEKEGLGNRVSDAGDAAAIVLNTGDVMLDVADWARKDSHVIIDKPDVPYAVFTMHRDFNTDNPERLAHIVGAVSQLGKELKVIFPVHPRTDKAMSQAQKDQLEESGCDLRPPLSYKSLIKLVEGSKLVITDSGGLQKEAFFFEKPVIIPRAETEWAEMVEVGCAELVDDNPELLLESAKRFLNQPPSHYPKLYGDGKSAQRMISAIHDYFK